ncbi:hypothetical protein GmHk_09G025525 [Glycine max]|nr:hypothetical protein GmHk_09G025525 [Glycine max]
MAPTTTRSAGNAHFGASSNTMRNYPPRPIPEFTPLPMTYEDLLSSLIANQLAVITPEKIFQPPFPKWYDPNATCAYHGKTPGHSIEKCLALKYKVQHLIDVGWLTFQEDQPNVKTNPLVNHGGGVVNAIESDRPRRSKPLRDVATPRRFIYEALQKGGLEDLLQRMIDQGRLEVDNEGREEQHKCMQSADERSFGRPKPLVIYFTKGTASQKPRYPSAAKPVPFPYQNSHAVLWRYTPPDERKEEATDISSLSAKVTNIMGLSGVTRSGRVFAPTDLPIQPTNVKGKAKVVEEQDDKTPLTPNEDIPSEFKVIEQLNKTPARVSLLELLMSSEPHRALLVKVLNEAHVDQDISVEGFGGLANNITANNYLAFAEEEIPAEGRGHNKALRISVKCMDHIVAKVLIDNGSSLNSEEKLEESQGTVIDAAIVVGRHVSPLRGEDNGGITSLISARGNRGKLGLGYKPTQADIRRSVAGRKSGSQGSRLRQEDEGSPPCHISRSFISAGLEDEGQVVTICEDDAPSGSDLVRPCPPGFRIGNWQVEERPDIYATSIM